MIWIVFSILLVLLATLVIGGICHGAGLADREIERLQDEERKI